jgi:hypothetical protein
MRLFTGKHSLFELFFFYCGTVCVTICSVVAVVKFMLSGCGSHQNSLLVALAHVNRASAAASTVAVFTENRHGSTASMNAATWGTPGGAWPNSSVGFSVGVNRFASARMEACWCGSYSCTFSQIYTYTQRAMKLSAKRSSHTQTILFRSWAH